MLEVEKQKISNVKVVSEMGKIKTMATVMLKHVHPTTDEEFWQRIFWKRSSGVTLAVPGQKVFELIVEGKLDTSELGRKAVTKKFGINENQLYRILATLKALGLIRKEYGEYKLSREFISRLERLIDYSEKYLNKAKEMTK